MIRKMLFYSMLLLPGLPLAHGDEDHGQDPKPAEVTSAAPRAEAQTDLFELVLTAHNGLLTIYVDRFASNQPVNDAKVEIESGNWKAVATAVEPGTYRLAAPQFAAPGTYPLVFTVTAGDDADLIETTLVISESAPVAASGDLPSRWGGIGAALIAVTVVATGLLQRRKSVRSGK